VGRVPSAAPTDQAAVARQVASALAAGPCAPVALDEADMGAVAAALAPLLPIGAVVAFHGDLGAGKTTFVRAMAEAFGVAAAEVTSPTFALVHEYASPGGSVVHADLYRLRRPEELDAIGWDELLAGARASLVEWPDRGAERLPRDTWHLALDHVAGNAGVRTLSRWPSATPPAAVTS
jgi:tRNA threonylcarbamoyl adenosine modification protein YjeE